jgi:hypothetical protein
VKRSTATALLVAACSLSACSSIGGGEGYGFSEYYAVNVHRVRVGNGNVTVVPPRPWNRHRPLVFEDIPAVEDWTLNGPLLDGITFITGLRNNKAMIRQRRTADQQVPVFRSNMTPPEIAAMFESLYRVRGGTIDFRTLSIQPRQFLGANGFQFDYERLSDDELWRKGRVVGAVINGELYVILYDAARSHYYEAALPDFEAIVASAQFRA